MKKDDINSISEISAGVIAARRDYQQDPEGSDIFMYYRKDIPEYDDENGLFDISVPGRNRNPEHDDKAGQPGNEQSDEDSINNLPVYKQMMIRYNMVVAENRHNHENEDTSDLALFILRSLKENPKMHSISINCGNNEKKTPPSAKALEELLSDLIYHMLSKKVPGKRSSRTEGSVVSVRGYIRKALEIIDGDRDEPGYPSPAQVRENTRNIDILILKRLIDNVALISVHNKVKDFFYNCGYREDTGDVTGKMRNKSLAMLDRFTREKNISSESLDITVFAQKPDVIALYDELLQVQDPLVFVPVAADSFGNTVIIAGINRLEIRLFYNKIPKGSKKRSCYFVLRTNRYEKGKAVYIPECTPVIEDVFISYDEALAALYSLNADYYDKMIAPFNNINSNRIINRYDSRLKGISSISDFLDDKKVMDQQILETIKEHEEQFEKFLEESKKQKGTDDTEMMS